MLFYNNDCWPLSNEAQCDLAFVQFLCETLGCLGMAGSMYLVPRNKVA